MLMFGIKAAVFAFLAALYNVAIGVWLSLVERLVRDQEVASSNLVTPIFYKAEFLQYEKYGRL